MSSAVKEDPVADLTRPASCKNKGLSRVFVFAVLAVVLAAGFLPWAFDGFTGLEEDDSGVFMYVGQQVSQGRLLYRDLWDNKPAVIYYLNAIGAALTPGSAAGIFSICLLSAAMFIAALQTALERTAPSLWSCAIVISTAGAFFKLAPTPNFTEAFALPLEGAALLLICRDACRRTPGREGFLIGAIAALLFNLRPNNIGLAAAYVLMAAWGDRRVPLIFIRRTAMLACGFAIACAALFAPLFYWGVFGDFVAAAFQTGARYAAVSGVGARLSALVACFGNLLITPLGIGAVLTAIASARGSARRGSRPQLLVFCCVWLGIEMLASTASGYRWTHYYLPCLPPLAMICGVLAGGITEGGSGIAGPITATGVAAFLTIATVAQSAARAGELARGSGRLAAPLELVRRHSGPAEAIFTWGPMPTPLWFKLNRPPGAPLFHALAYSNRALYLPLARKLMEDLERNPPPLILERRSIVPLAAAPDQKVPLNGCCKPEFFRGWDDASLTARKTILAQSYQEVESRGGYVLLRQRGTQAVPYAH